MDKEHLVFLTGAGISAESGLATFRGSGGMWNNYKIEDVCTAEALKHNRQQVIEFYNMRRKEVINASPNQAHKLIASLQNNYRVSVITQNVDDLHERGGSQDVLHLHGEIRKLCSSKNVQDSIPLAGWEQNIDAKHADGSLLRPFIVLFGESVPLITTAYNVVKKADILVIIGTSLAVYPAATLVQYVPQKANIYVIDPQYPNLSSVPQVTHIKANAVEGTKRLIELLNTKDS